MEGETERKAADVLASLGKRDPLRRKDKERERGTERKVKDRNETEMGRKWVGGGKEGGEKGM